MVSRSFPEVEYQRMISITYELVKLSFLFKDIQIALPYPCTLSCDNKAAQQIAANPYFHDRTEHLEIHCHYTRDKIIDSFITFLMLSN